MLNLQHAWLILLFCSAAMLLTWWWQQQCRNAGWVDVVWTALMGAQALIYAVLALSGENGLKREHPLLTAIALAAAVAGFWSLRLFWYLLQRVRGEAEDGRYRALRQLWAEHTARNFFWFFQAQALIAWALGLSFYLLFDTLARSGHVNGSLFLLGLGLGLLAIVGEGISDRQLARHRHQHPGMTCRSGLWRYSRHPNYFFEWLHWWSYPLMATSAFVADNELGQQGLWIWLAPGVMLLFLYRITGIPYTEKQALKSRGDDYRQYQHDTSAFIPWPPKT